MKVAIVQHDICWTQPAETLSRLSLLLGNQSGADVYVLAETFATGFMATMPADKPAGINAPGGASCGSVSAAPDAPGAASCPPGGSPAGKGSALAVSPSPLSWLQAQAREKDAAFVASIAVNECDAMPAENPSYPRYSEHAGRPALRNRLYFVRPDGTYAYYDKRHLFGYAGESDAYIAGDRRVVVTWRGVRFLLQVCYDLRFPVWSRNRQDYDSAIYVANWPTSRIDVWHTLLKARALENQCFIIGVNRVGSDPACRYCGGSAVIDAYGKTIAACTDNEEGVAVATLDMDRLATFRKKFPVLLDADEFTLSP